jgi:hypothetical protein
VLKKIEESCSATQGCQGWYLWELFWG